NERRGHHDVLARHVQVELLEQRDRVEILRGDQRDRNVVNVELVLPDEVKQEIQRALEIGQLDREGIRRRLEVRLVIHGYLFTTGDTEFLLYKIDPPCPPCPPWWCVLLIGTKSSSRRERAPWSRSRRSARASSPRRGSRGADPASRARPRAARGLAQGRHSARWRASS